MSNYEPNTRCFWNAFISSSKRLRRLRKGGVKGEWDVEFKDEGNMENHRDSSWGKQLLDDL